jgi:hypothetical protein
MKQDKFLFKSPVYCIICKKELKSIYDESFDCVDGGTVDKLYMPFGSIYDGMVFQMGLCDDCIDKLIKEEKIKEIGDYLNPEFYGSE